MRMATFISSCLLPFISHSTSFFSTPFSHPQPQQQQQTPLFQQPSFTDFLYQTLFVYKDEPRNPKYAFKHFLFSAQGQPRFGVSLCLFVDCLNTLLVPGHSNIIEIQYPELDMQLFLKSVDSMDACIYGEIRTRIPDTISWDYNFEHAGSTPLSFTLNSTALKEAINDLEWPGSSIQITLEPIPPSITFRGEGHGDLQIDFIYYVNTDLLIAVHSDHRSCSARGSRPKDTFQSLQQGVSPYLVWSQLRSELLNDVPHIVNLWSYW
ncbi:unnamed protein product, partial [Vitis vinifera]